LSFKVVLSKRVRKEISSWGLPDSVLVDVYLQLREALGDNPGVQLVHADDGYEGMVFPLALVDPANRLSVFRFIFRVVYGQDEETLFVLRGSMLHTFGS
jgi:hypothetical protein